MAHTKSEKTRSDLLQLWDKLELMFERHSDQGVYLARVEDITESGFLIDRPSWQSGEPLFQVGAACIATFVRADAVYCFHTKVLEKLEGNPNRYRMRVPAEIKRDQRRRYYRIDCSEEITLIPWDEITRCDDTEQKTVEYLSVAVSLSGNGVLVRTRMEASVGARLALKLKIEDAKLLIQTIGIIRRVLKAERDFFHYGIEFFTSRELNRYLSNMDLGKIPEQFLRYDEKQRTALLNHIFSEQLILRQKGLL